ncbi:MAG: ubiquinone-dependent pyruvate dehydrogenase [Muribaculaceae bacterium]|nr:ubiquinone-dependent pyruvate dehydrogenase [Muribaculaceae bacterium]
MKNTPSSPRIVADQIVDMLAGAGVKHIYGITGDSLNAITNAITDDDRIGFIHMRHEESAAFAASAEAQLTKRLAACAGSSGPGHVHLINGLYDAQRSNAPVLAIASTCPSSMFGTGYFQETNPTLLFSNCSLYNEMAVNAAQIPHIMYGAMQHAVSEGGVAVVGIPEDVNGQPAVEGDATLLPLFTQRKPQPSDEEIKAAADILNEAKTVTIFAGSGVSEAIGQLKTLADTLKAPVVTTFKSQMELTGDMPNYVGHLGYLGMWSADEAVAQADAILIIGTNFPFPSFFPTDKKIIQVDVRADRLGKKARVNLGVRSDATLFISALLPALKEKSDTTFLNTHLKDFAGIKEKMQLPVKNPGTKGNIRPEFVFDTLDRLAAEDAIFTVDTGMNCVWTSHYLTPSKGREMVGSFTHGSMANAMPMAIGAAVACPGRQVISLSGDGGLAMLLGDMLTINQYRLPVKILVADNRSLAYVQWEMELAGFKPSEVSLDNPDFAEMARTMGFHAETVTDPAALEDAMERWLEAEGPALLSVTTDTTAASFTFSKEMMEGAKPTDLTSNFLPIGS